MLKIKLYNYIPNIYIVCVVLLDMVKFFKLIFVYG